MPDHGVRLTESEQVALDEIKRRISARFGVKQFILFGSRARGDAAPDSDIDLMIVTDRELSHRERDVISDEIFDVNLVHGSLFSFVTVDERTWNSQQYRFLPLHANVEREGVPV